MTLGENGRETGIGKQFAMIRESLHTSLVMRSSRMTPADTSEWNKVIDQFVLLIELCEQTQVLRERSEVSKMADVIRKLLGSLKNNMLKEQIINDPRIAEKFRQVVLPAISLPYLRDLLMKDIPEPSPPSATTQEVSQVQSFAEESVEAIMEAMAEKEESGTPGPSDPHLSPKPPEVAFAPEVKEILLSTAQTSGTRDCDNLFDGEEHTPKTVHPVPGKTKEVSPIAQIKHHKDEKTVGTKIEELTKGKLQIIEEFITDALKGRAKDGHGITIEMWITKKDGMVQPHLLQIRKLMGASENRKDSLLTQYNSNIGKLELEITTTCDANTAKRLRLKIGALLLHKENYKIFGSYLLSD